MTESKSPFAMADSLQVAQTVVACSKRNGASEAEYVKAGLAELRRRLALLADRGLDYTPYEDKAVALLQEAGISLNDGEGL